MLGFSVDGEEKQPGYFEVLQRESGGGGVGDFSDAIWTDLQGWEGRRCRASLECFTFREGDD